MIVEVQIYAAYGSVHEQQSGRPLTIKIKSYGLFLEHTVAENFRMLRLRPTFQDQFMTFNKMSSGVHNFYMPIGTK